MQFLSESNIDSVQTDPWDDPSLHACTHDLPIITSPKKRLTNIATIQQILIFKRPVRLTCSQIRVIRWSVHIGKKIC